MDEVFELPVLYKNKKLVFAARFLRSGYSYKIEIDVSGQPILFEPDEERNWRAMINTDEMNYEKPDPELMHSIINSLDEHLR
jgi:hypothetical protein